MGSTNGLIDLESLKELSSVDYYDAMREMATEHPKEFYDQYRKKHGKTATRELKDIYQISYSSEDISDTDQYISGDYVPGQDEEQHDNILSDPITTVDLSQSTYYKQKTQSEKRPDVKKSKHEEIDNGPNPDLGKRPIVSNSVYGPPLIDPNELLSMELDDFKRQMSERQMNHFVKGCQMQLQSIGKKYIKLLRDHEPERFMNMLSPEVRVMMQDVERLEAMDELGGKNPKEVIALFVVFKPHPDETGIKEVEEFVSKIVKKKGVKDYWYNFEQTTEHLPEMEDDPPLGYGAHANILVYCNKIDKNGKHNQNGEPKRLRRNILNTAKQYVKDAKNLNVCCRVKAVTKENEEARQNYIMGMKSDKNKEEMMRMDRLWLVLIGKPHYVHVKRDESGKVLSEMKKQYHIDKHGNMKEPEPISFDTVKARQGNEKKKVSIKK